MRQGIHLEGELLNGQLGENLFYIHGKNYFWDWGITILKSGWSVEVNRIRWPGG